MKWYDTLFMDDEAFLATRRRERVYDQGDKALVQQQRKSSEAIISSLRDLENASVGIGTATKWTVIEQGQATQSAIRRLGALFDWNLQLLRAQFVQQTKTFTDINQILRNPIDTEAQELWRRAQFASERELFTEAAEDYEEALSKNRYLYPAHMQLAYIYAYHLGEREKAAKSFAAAARYAEKDDPTLSAQAHLQLCQFARDGGDLENAWKHILAATKLDPGLGPAWWDRAALAAEMARQDELLLALNRAIQIDSRYWERAKLELSRKPVSVWANQVEAVETFLDDILARLQQRFLEANSRLATVMNEANRFRNALNLLNATSGGLPSSQGGPQTIPATFTPLLSAQSTVNVQLPQRLHEYLRLCLDELNRVDSTIAHINNQISVSEEISAQQRHNVHSKRGTGASYVLVGFWGLIIAMLVGVFIVKAPALVLGVASVACVVYGYLKMIGRVGPSSDEDEKQARLAALEKEISGSDMAIHDRKQLVLAFRSQLMSHYEHVMALTRELLSEDIADGSAAHSYSQLTGEKERAFKHLITAFNLKEGDVIRATKAHDHFLHQGLGIVVQLYPGREEIIADDKLEKAAQQGDESDSSSRAPSRIQMFQTLMNGSEVPLEIDRIRDDGRLILSYCREPECANKARSLRAPSLYLYKAIPNLSGLLPKADATSNA